MLTLEDRLEAATRELHEVLDKAALRPATAVKQRLRRRRHAVTALAAIITVLAVAGLGFVVTRDVEPIEPGSSTSDPAAAQLLFPPGASEADVHLYLGPDLPTSAKVIIEAPDGALFRVAISERGGWQETPDVERRDFNGRTFTVESVDSELAYVSLNDCAVVGVDQWAPNAQAWDADASALLDTLTINGLTANVALQSGWRSYGVSHGGHLVQLAFSSKAAGSPRGVAFDAGTGFGGCGDLSTHPRRRAIHVDHLQQPTGMDCQRYSQLNGVSHLAGRTECGRTVGTSVSRGTQADRRQPRAQPRRRVGARPFLRRKPDRHPRHYTTRDSSARSVDGQCQQLRHPDAHDHTGERNVAELATDHLVRCRSEEQVRKFFQSASQVMFVGRPAGDVHSRSEVR